MRLAGIEKGGYYPIPPKMTELILTAVTTRNGKKHTRLLDPACGKGTALKQLAEGLNAIPYGNELNTKRFVDAKSLIDKTGVVINDDFINIDTPNGGIDILYLNPPYDWDKENGREEYRWLKIMRPKLAPGGLLIWVIPEIVLRDRNVQRYLPTWFDDLTIYRFRGDLYEAFKQVIVYGIHREQSQRQVGDTSRAIRQISEVGEGLTEHPIFDEPLYNLSNAKRSQKFWFYGIAPTKEAIAEELATEGAAEQRGFADAITPQPLVDLDPLVPMKIGHIASTLAAGHINNQIVETDKGNVLIKGSIYTEPISYTSQEQNNDRIQTKTTTVHDPRSVITTLDENGHVVNLKDKSLAEFLESNIEQVTNTLINLYPPRYQFKVGEWSKYFKGVNPRRIPNTNRMGLLPAQKHSAVAACVQWETQRDVLLDGQVGTGKTVISTSAAYAMHQKDPSNTHFVVLCPPHLVKKWVREIVAVWPAASAMQLKSVSDVETFFATEGPVFGVMKSTTASAADGWTHRINCGGPVILGKTKKMSDSPDLIEAPARIEAAHKALSVKNPENNPGFVKHMKVMKHTPIKCPHCGSRVVVTDAKQKKANIPATFNDFTGRKMDCEKCGSPMWQDERSSNNGRYPLASYFLRKHKNAIDILIVDEAHQYKGEHSDRGHAYGRLVMASKRTMAMTGTTYGGKASTLFFLLYRLSADFRKAWTDYKLSGRYRMEWRRWAQTYGVMEETVTHSESISSSNTGTSKPNRNVKEVAGSSPAMMPWLLNRTIFVSLTDMGMALPKYTESVVEVEMDDEMKEQYNTLYWQLKAEVSRRLVRGDRSLLSKYLYALIFWPDSPWRPKVVADDTKTYAAIPGTGRPVGSHPKERRILDDIKEELKVNRRVLLLVQQTNTLDIQPQWQDALAREGISSAILRGTPKQRERWIAEQEKKGTQVIISHPKRVETGLDILSYPTIIWMAPEFSIFTVIQASGRAFRLGQTRDCKVIHYAYKDTLQEQALSLVIAKAAAAKRVRGETIEKDDLADLDRLASDSIINALAKVMAEPKKHDTIMTEINLDYEQAQLGMFKGHFKDCATLDEAKTHMRKLAKKYHPDTREDDEERVITSLSDMFAKANEEFHKAEDTYVGGTNIQDDDDDDPEYVEPEPEPQPVEKPGVLEVIKKDIAPKPERIEFGKASISVKSRKRKKVSEDALIGTQLSLF